MDPNVTRRAVLRNGVGVVGALGLASGAASAESVDTPAAGLETARGFVASPLAPADAPTALSFGPGSGSATSTPRR